MDLISIRNNLKKQFDDHVIFIKYGNFYRVFDCDTYIVWYYTNYKINRNRLGFPITELDKIKDILIKNNISIVIYDDNSFDKVSALKNKYNDLLIESKEEYKKYNLLEQLKKYDCLSDIEDICIKYGINCNY